MFFSSPQNRVLRKLVRATRRTRPNNETKPMNTNKANNAIYVMARPRRSSMAWTRLCALHLTSKECNGCFVSTDWVAGLSGSSWSYQRLDTNTYRLVAWLLILYLLYVLVNILTCRTSQCVPLMASSTPSPSIPGGIICRSRLLQTVRGRRWGDRPRLFHAGHTFVFSYWYTYICIWDDSRARKRGKENN